MKTPKELENFIFWSVKMQKKIKMSLACGYRTQKVSKIFPDSIILIYTYTLLTKRFSIVIFQVIFIF